VDVSPLRFRVELGGRDDPYAAALAFRDRVGDSAQRVVIGQRLDPYATLGGARDQLGWRERAV
jgi:hypothetical protein